MTTYSGASGIAPAGVMATGALGDAPAPTAPPMGGGVTQILRYKVLDPVTGAVLVDDLPHLHQSKWDVVGFQAGATGRSATGTFDIKLFPPGSDGYKNAKAFYDLLDYGQRIEPYRGDIVAGDPWPQAGVIKAIVKSYAGYTISGDVSVGLLNLARSGLNEVFSGTTDALVRSAIKAMDLTAADDFSAGLAAFTNDGGWTTTTDMGGTAVQPGLTGDGLLYTTNTYANSKYADCSIEIPFRLVCEPTPNASAEISVVAALADTSNYVMGHLLFRYVTSTRYEVDLYIYDKTAGVFTAHSPKIGAFAVPSNTLPGQLELKGYQATLNTYLWRFLLNGRDLGCFWIQNVAAGAPSGKIGIRSAQSTSGRTNEQVFVAGAPFGLIFWSKNNWFQEGRISTGTRSLNQAIPDMTNMDQLQLAATTEGGEYRITAHPGLNQDTIDFGLTVGSDFSAMIRFDSTNIIECSVEPNAEDFGTVIQSPASPSLGGAGFGRMPTIASVRTRGNRTVETPGGRISDILAHRFFQQSMANLSSNPGQAMRIKVRRDEWADRVRELDWVTVDLPEFGKNKTRMKIVGYTFNEGEGTTEFLMNQYPRRLDRVPQFDRLLANVQFLMSQAGGATTATDPANPGQIIRASQTILPVNLWKLRVYLGSVQNLAKNSDVKVLYDTVDKNSDTAYGFSATNSNYTAQMSGRYTIDAAVNFVQPLEANQLQWWYAAIYVNGVIAKQGQVSMFAQNAGAISVTTCAGGVAENDYFLNAGDVVDIRFHIFCGAATVALNVGSAYTTWSMHLLSG